MAKKKTNPSEPAPELSLGRPVKHLLVDLDGTILGNRNLALSAEFGKQALRTLKVYGGWRKAAKVLFAMNKEFTRPSKDSTNDIRVVALFAQQMNLSIEEGARVLRDGVRKIFPSLEKHFYPIEGAKDFLDWARENYTLTLATNPVWPTEIIELRVRWAGIDPSIFRSITHIREMHACKPAMEYYDEILTLGGLRAEDCLLIGNDVKMDLPATRVGIRTFIVGPFKTVSALKYPKGKAEGWKGSYIALRELLEKSGV